MLGLDHFALDERLCEPCVHEALQKAHEHARPCNQTEIGRLQQARERQEDEEARKLAPVRTRLQVSALTALCRRLKGDSMVGRSAQRFAALRPGPEPVRELDPEESLECAVVRGEVVEQPVLQIGD